MNVLSFFPDVFFATRVLSLSDEQMMTYLRHVSDNSKGEGSFALIKLDSTHALVPKESVGDIRTAMKVHEEKNQAAEGR